MHSEIRKVRSRTISRKIQNNKRVQVAVMHQVLDKQRGQCFSLGALVTLLSVCWAGSASALVPMSEDQMSQVQGTGLAIGFDDFSFRMAPTSFVELTGSSTSLADWERGDVRYFGLSMTGSGGTGADWFDGACSTGLCPLGGDVPGFAPANNPYVFRAFDNPGFAPDGTNLNGGTGDNEGPIPTNIELVGPTASSAWRWSFWGEIEVGRDFNHTKGAPHEFNLADGDNGDPRFLQSQTIIDGRNIATGDFDPATIDDNRASIFRVFQTRGADETFGFTYQSALSGDFRFSVAQTTASPDELHRVPEFDTQEGVHFKNVDAFLPMGRLHSQFFSLDSTEADDGNFVVELSAVPDSPNAYTDIYCGNAADTDCSTWTDYSSIDYFGNEVETIQSHNEDTHGYIRWGDINGELYGVKGDSSTCSTTPCGEGTGNGIFFRSPGGDVNNIGVARMEEVLIQKLRFETLGI